MIDVCELFTVKSCFNVLTLPVVTACLNILADDQSTLGDVTGDLVCIPTIIQSFIHFCHSGVCT